MKLAAGPRTSSSSFVTLSNTSTDPKVRVSFHFLLFLFSIFFYVFLLKTKMKISKVCSRSSKESS